MVCPDEKTRVTYTGSALPGNAESVVLFSSTTAFGARAAPHYRCFWFDVELQTDAAAGTQTLTLQKSADGGANWVAVGAAIPIPIGQTQQSFYVAPYADFRIVYLNGSTPQTAFAVDMIIDHNAG